MQKEKKIYVFADFLPFQNELIGTIYVSQTRGKEFYSFEYEQSWLEKGNMMLDPDLQLYKGRQYINDDKNIFGVFADSCPDRWGKRLMKRREELRAKKAGEKPQKLLESDYLLGVYDEARMIIAIRMLRRVCLDLKQSKMGNSFQTIKNMQHHLGLL